MIQRIIRSFAEKTGVHLHPRFVGYTLVLSTSLLLLLFSVIFYFWYSNQVAPKLPFDPTSQEYVKAMHQNIPGQKEVKEKDSEDSLLPNEDANE